MQFFQFVRSFPVYWFLTLISQMIMVLSFCLGVIAGVWLFGLVFPLPPQSGFQEFALIACSVGLGIYIADKFGKKWQHAIRAITAQIERDMNR
jgi:hypothetical protein